MGNREWGLLFDKYGGMDWCLTAVRARVSYFVLGFLAPIGFLFFLFQWGLFSK
jgi:hypothetical protein